MNTPDKSSKFAVMQEENEKKQGKETSEKKMLNNYARYSGMAFQMVAVIGLFAFAGYSIDKNRASSTPLFTALLSLAGVCISLYLVIRSIKNLRS